MNLKELLEKIELMGSQKKTLKEQSQTDESQKIVKNKRIETHKNWDYMKRK